MIPRTVSLVNKKEGSQTLTCSGWKSVFSTDESCLTVPCQNEECPYKCCVCLLRACINCPWEHRLQTSSSSPVFVSARVIDAKGIRIRADLELTVDWCEPLYGTYLSGVWVYALVFQERVWDVDFCAAEIYQSAYYIQLNCLTNRFAPKPCLSSYLRCASAQWC